MLQRVETQTGSLGEAKLWEVQKRVLIVLTGRIFENWLWLVCLTHRLHKFCRCRFGIHVVGDFARSWLGSVWLDVWVGG